MSKRTWRKAIEFGAAAFIGDAIIEAQDKAEESQVRIAELENRIKKLEGPPEGWLDDFYDQH